MSVAVVQGETILAEVSFSGRSHASRLLPAVDYVLRAGEAGPGSLSAIAVSNGPGSFTGLRIGLSFAKGLAESLGVPLVLVSTLLGLAAQCELHAGYIVPVLDAQRDEYYAAVFRSNAYGVERLTDDIIVQKGGLVHRLEELGARDCLVTGDAAEVAALWGGYRVAPAAARVLRAGVLGLVAQSLPTTDPRLAVPNYIRSSSARPKQRGV